MNDIERIVKLETEMTQVRGDIKKILENQEQMQAQLTKYKGFIGGVVFLGSCIWAMVTLLAKKMGF